MPALPCTMSPLMAVVITLLLPPVDIQPLLVSRFPSPSLTKRPELNVPATVPSFSFTKLLVPTPRSIDPVTVPKLEIASLPPFCCRAEIRLLGSLPVA